MDQRRRPVSEIMHADIVTLAPKETLDLTQDLMSLGRVRHLPVVDGHRLVGIISNRDLLAASLTKALDFDPASRRSFLRSVEVAEVMTRDVVSVAPDTTLADAARIMVGRQIGCLPIIDDGGKLLGLVTTTDLLMTLVEGEDEANERTADVETSKSSTFSDWIKKEVQDLRRIRDELRVKAHLGKAEVRDHWDNLERALEALEQRAKRTSRAAEQPLQQLEEDARKIARDVREGYRRIRDAL